MLEIRVRAKQAVLPILGALVVGYFSYHMVQGEYGVLAYLQLQAKVERAEILQADLRQQRDMLELRVALLHPDSLDRDMLEERARVMLNYARPDDVIIMER
ncbi:MAG: FtsB family cell division protein [Alphaproteobacteria bacterium]